MVLRVGIVRDGGYRYYVEDLVPGRAEGSPVAGEEPGRWTGAGCSVLGLHGTVESAALAALLDGRRPSSQLRLRARHGTHSVAAYDLVFAAPKSVSLLHLLAPREIATAVGTSHAVAVADATGYLSRRAVGVRRTRSGERVFAPSTGVTAAEFLHRTSRSLDPHLHTHLVVANATQGLDGVWSAIDSRRLHAHLPAIQALYHARLRLELDRRLGAAVSADASGLGDVLGVDPRLCRLFSQRTAGAAEHDFLRGGPSGHRSRLAFLLTRAPKDRTVTVGALQKGWKDRAGSFGFDLGELTRVVGRTRQDARPGAFDPDRLFRHLDAVARGNRVLSRVHMVAGVAMALPRGATSELVEQAVGMVTDPVGRVADLHHGPGDHRAGALRPGARSPGEGRWRASEVAGVVRDRAQVLASFIDEGIDRERGGTAGRPCPPPSLDLATERHARRGMERVVGLTGPVLEC